MFPQILSVERVLYVATALTAALILALIPFLGLTEDETRKQLALLAVIVAWIVLFVHARASSRWSRIAPFLILPYVLFITLGFTIMYRALHIFWIFYFALPVATALFFGATWAYLVGGLSVLGYLAIVIAHSALRLDSPEELLNSSALVIFSLLAGGLVQSRQHQQAELERRVVEKTAALQRELAEHQRAEIALRESEEKYRLIVENISEIIYKVAIADDPLQGTVQFISNATERIIGYSVGEFFQDPGLWRSIIHPDDVPAIAETTQRIVVSREPGFREYRLRHKVTGEYRWMSDRVVPLLDDQSKVIGYQGVARDITASKEAEARLAFQATILRNVTNSVIVTDLEGKIIYWNEGACTLA